MIVSPRTAALGGLRSESWIHTIRGVHGGLFYLSKYSFTTFHYCPLAMFVYLEAKWWMYKRHGWCKCVIEHWLLQIIWSWKYTYIYIYIYLCEHINIVKYTNTISEKELNSASKTACAHVFLWSILGPTQLGALRASLWQSNLAM